MAVHGLRRLIMEGKLAAHQQIFKSQAAFHRKQFSTSSPQKKVFELRTYSIHPANFPAYISLTSEKMHLRTEHSKLYGFWISELGGCNQAVHLWEYESLEQRAEVRAALSKDSAWIEEYVKLAFGFIQRQDNWVVSSLPGTDVESFPLKEGGVYELHELVMKPGHPDAWLNAVSVHTRASDEVFKQLGHGKLMGVWQTQIGTQNTVYQLWNYTSVSKILPMRAELQKDANVKGKDISHLLQNNVVTKMLLPLTFSPLK